jgi:ribosomal protein L13
VSCTFTNTGTTAGVTLTKSWASAVTGDTTTLTISGDQVSGATGGDSTAPSTTTAATATAVGGSTVNLAEGLGGGNKGSYTPTLACTSNGAPVTVTNNSITMPAPAAAVTCTFTNTGTTAGVTLTKSWVNAVNGDSTTLTISGAQVSGATGGNSSAPSTTSDAAATAVGGSTVNLAEGLGGGNKGSYTTTLACTSNGAPVTVTNNSITMPTPATAVTCTFTNTGAVIGVTLTKSWVNAVDGDTTTLTISGAQVTSASGGNSTAPSTTTNATAIAISGSNVDLAEALGGNNVGGYTTAVSCVSDGQSVPVINGTITAPQDGVTCTITNTNSLVPVVEEVPVPTLSQWAYLVLGMLLLGAAWAPLRRRR